MVFDKMKEIIMETMDCDEAAISMEASLKDDLAMDSLDAMELSMAIEEAYDLTIEEEALQNFITVADIVKYVESKIA